MPSELQTSAACHHYFYGFIEFTHRGTTRGTREFNQLSFFHKNNALSSSSGTLLRARGKITLDTQELNVHEHLIIYFDFDLKRKIILLLHLLFLLSIMAVRSSQTSNILTLVHLLLSCSLLIVQDELRESWISLASYADVLRLVTRSSPRTSAQRTGHIRSLAVSQS